MQAGGADSYVLFALAGATYALRSDDIQQLEMVGTPTPVPNAPGYVDGVVSVRGQVLPVINLRARFGFPRVPQDLRSRLIIVRSLGRSVGLVVDSAREFASIPPQSVKPLPDGVAGLSGRYLSGVAQHGERLTLIVDVAELLRDEGRPADSAPIQAAHDASAAGASA